MFLVIVDDFITEVSINCCVMEYNGNTNLIVILSNSTSVFFLHLSIYSDSSNPYVICTI